MWPVVAKFMYKRHGIKSLAWELFNPPDTTEVVACSSEGTTISRLRTYNVVRHGPYAAHKLANDIIEIHDGNIA